MTDELPIVLLHHLRWSDVDFERDVIRWRVQHDKIGLEHETPMSPAGRAALVTARKHGAAIGDRWIFPAPRSPDLVGDLS
jgi:integrase